MGDADVATNPGQSVEQIGKALGVTITDLAPPINRMLDEKKLSKKGERRGTWCFPAGAMRRLRRLEGRRRCRTRGGR